jgi:hypothetical protein
MARGLLKSEWRDKDRETREGWPLLAPVETELNGYSKRTNERGSFLVCSLGIPCRYKISLLCIGGCSSRPSTKYYIKFFGPFPQQAGQAAVLGRLSLSVCLWIRTRNKICEQTLDARKATHLLCIFFYCVGYVFLNNK